jgi:hypothetical protein
MESTKSSEEELNDLSSSFPNPANSQFGARIPPATLKLQYSPTFDSKEGN